LAECMFLMHSKATAGGSMSNRKWRVLILVLATVVFCLEVGGAVPELSLREAADKSGVLVGTAVRPAQLSEPEYASTLAREFNMLEPEDVLKWETVHPQRQSFDFSQPDRLIDFAAAHGMKVRGHTLVWHQQNPKWLTDGNFSSEELAQILKNHIKTVVGHYRGKIFAWDVVNEAFDELHPVTLRNTIWTVPQVRARSVGANLGPTQESPKESVKESAREPEKESSRSSEQEEQPAYFYIEQAFRWAHEADPAALLFYNEAEANVVNPKSDAVYAMVQDFRRRGVPINGVGLQMHIANLQTDVSSISANIQRFTELGVQVHITEMDVSLPVDPSGDAHPEDLQRQADLYREIAAACLSHPGCTAIQTWGFTDKYSWIGSHSKHTKGAALLFDGRYQPKLAYRTLRIAFEEAKHR
jgi:endo-1,4-beta-xylanase